MSDIGESDLIEIIADVLHRSGPSMNPERNDMMQARLRANAVVQELLRRRLVVAQPALAPARETKPAA
jgi:hypothetical protein